MLKALVIDDLAPARASLMADLADYCPDLEVLGQADGVVAGVKAIQAHHPDLVFLDIDMPDGTGFDLLEIVGDKAPHIIFTTASDAHAIRAFQFSAIDYLLKPVDPDLLVKAVEKVSQSNQEKPDYALLKENLGTPQRLSLNSQDKIEVVKVGEIVRCEANASYTIFYLSDEREVVVTRTLKEYDQLLSPQGFLRVHQSHLINLDYIKSFVKTDGGYVVMKNGTDVPVSSRKRSDVLKALGV